MSKPLPLKTRVLISFLPVLTGLFGPFIHLSLLNGGNLTLPLQVHLPLLVSVGLGIVALGMMLQSLGPARLRITFSCLLLALGIYFWAQGTILLGNFGFLKGGEIDWSANQHLLYFELMLVGAILAVAIGFREKFARQAGWITLLVTLSALANLYPAFQADRSRTTVTTKHTFTKEGVTSLSPEKNVLLFIVDTYQSDVFAEIISENPGAKKTFDGFTYFPNTISAFPKTYLSIPNILTGKAFDNSQPFSLFLRDAFLGNSAPKVLKDNGFDVRYRSFTWQPYFADPAVADNLSSVKSSEGRKWMQQTELVQLSNLVLFRLAPFAAKPWVYNDNEFRIQKPQSAPTANEKPKELSDETRIYSQDKKTGDLAFHDEMMAFLSTDSEKPAFRVFHFVGVHEPLDLDRDLKYIGKQPNNRHAFRQQAEGMLKMLSEEISKLKEIGAFDNSLIIIVGDHGCGEHEKVGFNPAVVSELGLDIEIGPNQASIGEEVFRSAAPIMLVKPLAADGPLEINAAPVELADIPNTIFKSLGLEKASSGPSVFEIPQDETRIRHHRYYRFAGWGQDYIVPLTEYRIEGFGWDPAAWSLSGRDLNRNAIDSHAGRFIVFGKGGNLDDYQHSGWTKSGLQGRRVADKSASIEIPFTPPANGAELLIKTRPDVKASEATAFHGFVNDQPLATWYSRLKTSTDFSAHIPARYFEKNSSLEIRLEKETAKQKSPLIIEIRLDEQETIHRLEMGESIDFLSGGNSPDFKKSGWEAPEHWGTWSLGHQPRLLMQLDSPDDQDLEFSARFRPAVFPKTAPLLVSVLAAGHTVDQWVLTQDDWQTRVFRVPAALVPETGNLELVFSIKNPRSPRSANKKSGDRRNLGLGMESLTVDLAEDSDRETPETKSGNIILDPSLSAHSRGLSGIKNLKDTPVVWTSGVARIQWPVEEYRSQFLKFEIEDSRLRPCNLLVFANERLVYSNELESFPFETMVNLPDITQNGVLNLEFFSPASNLSGEGVASPGLALSNLEISDFSTSSSQDPTLPRFIDLSPGASDKASWDGLHNTERWDGIRTTWTNGQAHCQGSLEATISPKKIFLEIVHTSGGNISFSLDCNGTRLLENQNFVRHWAGILDVSHLDINDSLNIDLTSETFIPAQKNPQSRDRRNLGVAIRKLIVLE